MIFNGCTPSEDKSGFSMFGSDSLIMGAGEAKEKTIDAVRQDKRALEKWMIAMITEYEKFYGVKVTDINLCKLDSGKTFKIFIDVEV